MENDTFEGDWDAGDNLVPKREHSAPALSSLGARCVSCAGCKSSMECLECRSDGNFTAPQTIPGSQPEEQVKKDAGDPVRSIIRAKETEVSNNDGVAGSGFGAKVACEEANGKRLRGGWVAVKVAMGGAKDGRVVCDEKVSRPGTRGEELGVENEMSGVSFKLS